MSIAVRIGFAAVAHERDGEGGEDRHQKHLQDVAGAKALKKMTG